MAARSDSSSEEFNSFEESEEGEESDDWEVPDHAPIRTDSCPNASSLSPLPHQPAESFLQFISVTFPQEQQPLASELSFSLLFRSLDLKRAPALLNAAIWFVGCPESRTTEHDQLLDEIEFGPFCAFGDSADFSIAFSCQGPDLSRIPDISSLDVTCILIRVSCSGAPALLIPFVVSVDSQLLLRQLFRARPCFDSRSPITSELHPSRIHPPPPVKTTSHPGPVLVSPTIFPYAPPSSLLPTAATPSSSSSSFLDSTADSFFSFGDPLIEPFGALQLNCNSPFPPSNAVAICAIQIDSVDCTSVEQRDQNLRHACDIIRQAHQQRASQEEVALYLLPELSSTGYRSDTFLNLDILAEADRGPSYQMFSSLASSLCCYISYGFPRKIDDGVSICHAIINPTKSLILYDKCHLCNYGDCAETLFFSRPPSTDLRMPTFCINGLTFGLAICYDIRFPEFFRRLAMEGAVDVILHPGGWPRDSCFSTWHPFVICRAVENQCVVVSVNRAGPHFGNSIIAGPWVDDAAWKPITAPDNSEVTLWRVVTRDEIQNLRDTYQLRSDRLDYQSISLSQQDF